jgi:hypothetical protein
LLFTSSDKAIMNKTEFVKLYVAAFVGAWAAQVTEAGRPGWQKSILNPPIEDAVFQAEESWRHCRERKPGFFCPDLDENDGK